MDRCTFPRGIAELPPGGAYEHNGLVKQAIEGRKLTSLPGAAVEVDELVRFRMCPGITQWFISATLSWTTWPFRLRESKHVLYGETELKAIPLSHSRVVRLLRLPLFLIVRSLARRRSSEESTRRAILYQAARTARAMSTLPPRLPACRRTCKS